MLQKILEIKIYPKKLKFRLLLLILILHSFDWFAAFHLELLQTIKKLRLKNTTTDETLTYASETWILTKSDRKQINIFERKVYRRILGPVYDNEKENWRILTSKEIYAMVKKNPL